MDEIMTDDLSEVSSLLKDGYEIDSIAYWVSNGIPSFSLVKSPADS